MKGKKVLVVSLMMLASLAIGGCDDCSSETDDKPVIYVYPTEKQEVSVKLSNPSYLTCTYPEYKDGWNVVAYPDGTLVEQEASKKLYSLYWEGDHKEQHVPEAVKNQSEGYCVAGSKTAEFLEEKLEQLGLNYKEKEEFIIYWLPRMQENAYNYIYFETQEEIDSYEELQVEPKPETLICIQMDWKTLKNAITVKEQNLPQVERKGYTVVEWGGSELE